MTTRLAAFGLRERRSPVPRKLAGRLVGAVAIAAVGASLGAATPASASDACPNAALRTGPSANLPDCRAYERVSPVEIDQNRGASVGAALISDDGDRVAYSAGWMLDAPSAGINNAYVAQRSSSTGWITSTNFVRPPAFFMSSSSGAGDDMPSDLSAVLWNARTASQVANGQSQYFRATLAGGWEPASPVLVPLSGDPVTYLRYVYLGGSHDLSRFVFVREATPVSGSSSTQHVKFLPEDPIPVNSNMGNAGWPNLYLVSGATSNNPTLDLVNRDIFGDGSVIGPACGAQLGSVTQPGGTAGLAGRSARHAISHDGATIYFTARPNATNPATRTRCTAAGLGDASPTDPPAPARVFAKRDGHAIDQVSKSICSRPVDDPCAGPINVDDFFEGASVDGSRVFFTTTRQLTNSDHDTTNDLYSYDFNPLAGHPNLVQVSRGDLGSGLSAGDGGQVQGVSRLSDDGSRAYFVAHGVLTEEPNASGALPTAGAKNLYVWRRDDTEPAGSIAFIATLAAGDSANWAARDARKVHAVPVMGQDVAGREIGGDGHVLFFTSAGQLTPDAPTGTVELYRYVDGTSGTETLERLSRDGLAGDPNATQPLELSFQDNTISSARYANERRAASEDGTIVAFSSARPMVGGDTNGVSDVYRWREMASGGDLSLVSDGSQIPMTSVIVTRYSTMSPSGSDIVFSTEQALVPQDQNGGGDIYTARVGGGIEIPPVVPKPPCVGQACQGPIAGSPSLPSIGSVSFDGDGNVSLPNHVNATVDVSRAKVVAGFAAKLRVRVPAAGRISLLGPRVRRVARSTGRAGVFALRVALKPRLRKLLVRRKTLRAGVSVLYRAKDGQSASKRVVITFKQPKAKRVKTRKGGR